MKGARPISTMKLFDAAALAQAGTSTSVAIDLREIDQNHTFALSYTIVGAGTVKMEYHAAPEKDGVYVEPSAASDIVAAAAVGSNTLAFSPVLTPFMKIKLTENNVGTITSITVWIHIQ